MPVLYLLSPVEAKKALTLFTAILGSPVSWPSDEELKESKRSSHERLQQFMRRSSSKANDEGQDDDDDDDEGEPDAEGKCEAGAAEGAAEEGSASDNGEEEDGTADEEAQQDQEEDGAADEEAQQDQEGDAIDLEVCLSEVMEEDEDGCKTPVQEGVEQLTDLEKQTSWRLHKHYLKVRKLPANGLAPAVAMKAIRMIGIKHGRLRECVTHELINAFIMAEHTRLSIAGEKELEVFPTPQKARYSIFEDTKMVEVKEEPKEEAKMVEVEEEAEEEGKAKGKKRKLDLQGKAKEAKHKIDEQGEAKGSKSTEERTGDTGQQAETQVEYKPTRIRRKISPELDCWIVNSYLAAKFDANGDR